MWVSGLVQPQVLQVLLKFSENHSDMIAIAPPAPHHYSLY